MSKNMRFVCLILVFFISFRCTESGFDNKNPGDFDFTQGDLETGIQVQISEEKFQKIKHKREEALQRNHLLKSDSDYVKGILVCNGKKAKVKLRLKGEEVDHLQGEQWSFRISSKKKDFVGQHKFSVQGIHTKDYLNEWLFQTWAKDLGIVALDYFFVPFSINDTLQGIYAFEGQFDAQILANCNRPNGIILKFDEDILWEQKEFLGHSNRDSILMVNAKIDVFNAKKIKADPTLSKHYMDAVKNLDDFRKGKVKPSSVLDYPLWTKYFALSELLGSSHNLRWINVRFYYNPQTKLFEPVAFDCFSNGGHGDRTTQIWFQDKRHETFVELFLNHDDFKNELQKQIVLLSEKQKVLAFLHANHAKITNNIKLIKQQKPDYFFDKNPLLKRAAYLHQVLK